MGMTQHELNLTLEQKGLAPLVDIRYELDRPYGRARLEPAQPARYESERQGVRSGKGQGRRICFRNRPGFARHPGDLGQQIFGDLSEP
jgi:hypothetical protein